MPTIINNRYELRDKLGQGGMGAVYLAHDRLTQNTVALKQVIAPVNDLQFSQSNTQDQLIALATEFRTLASLRHPHIISVLDYGFSNGQPFFTMEYLPGGSTILDAAKDQSQSEQIRYINELLLALDYLHRRGVIHRDLKPDNVLVSDTGQVKVLDFGLALNADTVRQHEDEVAGTMAYMAPELFAEEQATIQSDLYAVGMIAFEILVGEYPFNRRNIALLVNGILNEDPDTTSLDYDLGELLDQLLAKAPDQRPAQALQVINDLCAATDLPVPEESATIRESYLQASKLVGRKDELTQLQTHLQTALDGASSFVLLGGESGVGKSRLVDELRSRALVKGAIVLRGQGVAEGGLPFQLWRTVARRLILNTDLSQLEAGIIKAIVSDISTLLNRDIPDAPKLDGKAGQDRLVFTLVEMFKRQTDPVVLLLEDLQWAVESLEVLKQMLKVSDQLPKLLVVGTYRDDEAPDLPEQVPDMTLMALKRLLKLCSFDGE